PEPASIPPPPAHINLTPFPTRRSSDLRFRHLALGERHAAAFTEQVAPRRAARRGALTRGRPALCANVTPHDRNSLPTMVLPSLRDRKSTRLNSSHVAISYAVFCLKKKN